MAEVVAALRHDFIQAAAAKDEAAGTSKKQRAEARESAEVATRTVRSRSWLPVLIEVNSHGEVTSVQLDTPEGAVHISSPDIDTKWQQMQPVVTHQVAAPVPAVDVHVATTAAPPHRHAVPTAAGATTAAPPRRHAVPTAAGATSGSGNGGGGGAKAATAATSARDGGVERGLDDGAEHVDTPRLRVCDHTTRGNTCQAHIKQRPTPPNASQRLSTPLNASQRLPTPPNASQRLPTHTTRSAGRP